MRHPIVWLYRFRDSCSSLLENAYIHGLNQNAGLIRISAHKADKLLTIIIEDDGKESPMRSWSCCGMK